MDLTWSELNSRIISSAREKRTLVSASFELTCRCNLQCKMCYICESAKDTQLKAKELSAAQWICLAKEARELGLLYVTLTGGEVFLREDFREIYEQLMKLGFVLQIYTNGTMITSGIIRWLVAMPPSKISITLYGASRETYEKVTGYADGYDRAVRAIDALLAAEIPVELKTTVVHGNMKDYDQMAEFARKRKVPFGIVNYISPRREGTNSDPVGHRLLPEELAQYEKHFKECNHKLGNGTISIVSDAVSEKMFTETPHSKRLIHDADDALRCSAGKCAAWVTWDGRLLACGIMAKPIALPLVKGFAAAWEELKFQCTLIPLCKECQTCEYLESCDCCPARLLNETGYYDQPAHYLCEIARERAKERKEVSE